MSNEHLVFDIESNDLLYGVDRFHVITIFDLRSKALCSYFTPNPNITTYPSSGTIGTAIERLCNAKLTIGHNIAGYDWMAIKKLYGNNQLVYELDYLMGTDKMYDTLKASELLFPEKKHHGLGAWGETLGIAKPEQEQWEVLDEPMIHRNRQDVTINVALYNRLMLEESIRYKANKSGPLSMNKAMDTETKVAQIHAGQVETGVRLDILKVKSLIDDWDPFIKEMSDSIVNSAPMQIVDAFKGTPVNKPFLGNGKYSAMTLKHFGLEEVGRDEATRAADEAKVLAPFTRIKYDKLNMDSSAQLKTYMLSIGWRPKEWNYSKKTGKKTSPKLTEDSYESLPGPMGETIAMYNILTHRRGSLLNMKGKEKGAVWNCRDDGRVPAEAFTCGTPTSRYRHTGSICNLPDVEKAWGAAVRSCYCVPDGYWMIGVDLSGIEIRMMCHFCYNLPGGHEFAELVLNGDYHQSNAEIWGVQRSLAKRGLYMLKQT